MVVRLADSLAIIAGKASARAIRTLGAGLGSNLPGRVARIFSRQVLSRLAGQCRQGVVAVTGTNGKSTTSGIIHSIFRQAGLKTIHNRQGANLVTGITASVVEAAGMNAKLDTDYCLFEIDEASLPVVAREVPLKSIVVTNLFRDQLDRFGELDATARLIEEGIALSRSLAVLNADDPNVAQLARGAGSIYFGMEFIESGGTAAGGAAPRELAYCPGCGEQYAYDLIFYGQLGHYHCLSCGNGRPAPMVAAQNVSLNKASSSFTLLAGDEQLSVTLPLPGLFNVYNALAASALCFSLGIPGITIAEGIKRYTTLFGRSEQLTLDGKQALIQLIKNPAGASQVLSTVAADESARILIAINDNLADGRDVSWLWDAQFELLSGHGRDIVVSGQRALDMAVRLKHAGLPSERIVVEPSLNTALTRALSATADQQLLWILPTYTCLLELQKLLKERGVTMSGT